MHTPDTMTAPRPSGSTIADPPTTHAAEPGPAREQIRSRGARHDRPAAPVRARKKGRSRYAWAGLRITLGWVFLWAFVDKLLGLGFATTAENAWIRGGSPTTGFLTFAAQGPFAGMYNAMAGSTAVDALFMTGLLGVGAALMLGIGVRIACWSGMAMMGLMYLALLPPENNPVVDDHIVYMIALLGISLARAGRTWGLGGWWSRSPWVRRHPWLE